MARPRRTSREIFLTSLKKSFYWHFLTTALSNLTILLIAILAMSISDYNFKENIVIQTQQLVFLFFSIGIASSIGIDYIFLKKKLSYEANIWIYSFAALILVFGIVIITLTLIKGIKQINPEIIKLNLNVQYLVLFISFVYSFSVKTIMFIKE